jgi:hypothetical protein
VTSKAGKGNVGQVSPAFVWQSKARQGLINFLVECCKRVVRRNASPEGVIQSAPFKLAQAIDMKRDFCVAKIGQHKRDIFCQGSIHPAYKPQCQVQLIIILPPRTFDTTHNVDQLCSHRGWRAKGDEQAKHGYSL